ncbi:hypothetical protein [Fimbriiglobus ruber]|uniref:Uncharacterized protein n=1 Tax=Fimbriiglobus ruber TaxID=1908690 RepID=A0A225DW21_9BACT|nr:hypothetical protein [Fimbriiglobus ruber]OWK45740.1 hypothetical protein FRUB_02071 [Fimbriiglobus ruber]
MDTVTPFMQFGAFGVLVALVVWAIRYAVPAYRADMIRLHAEHQARLEALHTERRTEMREMHAEHKAELARRDELNRKVIETNTATVREFAVRLGMLEAWLVGRPPPRDARPEPGKGSPSP